MENSYECYKSVISDNEDLREKLKELEKELQQSKSDHTMDKARVVYAYHILNAGRDEHVLLHMDDKAREVVFWKMKYDKVFSEMEHYKKLVDDYQMKSAKQNTELQQYQKSNKSWQEKYDNLFKKHQEALGAIRELEYEIDRLQSVKRCCK